MDFLSFANFTVLREDEIDIHTLCSILRVCPFLILPSKIEDGMEDIS